MKKTLLLAVLLFISASLVTSTSATVPEGPYYYYGTGGTAVVDHPEFGLLMIRAANIKHSSPIPPHDLLTIYVWNIDLEMWVPIAIITDHALCEELGDQVFAGIVDVTLVDESDLEVWSRFKIVLKVPVAGIHPFEVRFKDQGRGAWMPEEVTPTPSGYTVRQIYRACEATAKVTGPDGCELPVIQAWVYHPWEMLITPPPS